MANRIQDVTRNLQQLAELTDERFGGLSAEQLNWKPSAKSWSVAQCLDHLIISHSLYFPLFERLTQGTAKSTAWERWSPFSGYFGRLLIGIVDPDNPKKSKATAKADPSASDLGDGIVDRFLAHQKDLIERIERLPADLDSENTIVTSPFIGFITYNVDDGLSIIVGHCKRHLDQARRVTEVEGFPEQR